jgi:TRAP-type C4-dicarboxylate transport system substrate-binding protein
MPEGDEIGEAILDAAGLAPIPLAISDVLTGLQTGLVNTVAAPPVGAVALQWFTKVKYLLELPIIYTYGFVVVDAKALGRLDDADQEIVREVLTRVTAQLDGETRGNNEEARQALVKQGIKIVTPAPEVEQQWYEIAAEARQNLVEKGAVGAELVARIEGTLQEYRDSTGGG